MGDVMGYRRGAAVFAIFFCFVCLVRDETGTVSLEEPGVRAWYPHDVVWYERISNVWLRATVCMYICEKITSSLPSGRHQNVKIW